VDDEHLYWIDRSSGAMISRVRTDGSQPAEQLVLHLKGVVSLYRLDDRLVYSHTTRPAFMSLPKAGAGMPPRLSPTLTSFRTLGEAGDQQFAVSSDGLVQRTPVTGELSTIWDGGGSNVRGYAVDAQHILVLTPDRVVCITR
jgi:hypothetical protein